jgi:hypothetical protein
MKYYVDANIEGIRFHKEHKTLDEAMRQALDFVENGEPVSVSDSNGCKYDVIKYWYELSPCKKSR